MPNQITRQQIWEWRASANRAVIWIEGVKYSGTANSGGTKFLTCNALQGVAEENIVDSGINENPNTFNLGGGTPSRQVLSQAGQNFKSTVMAGMTLVRNDTGAIHDLNLRGPLTDVNVRIGAPLTTTGISYSFHGFAKATPTDYTVSFQWNFIYIHTGTGKGQVRRIKSVYDDGTTVYLIVETDWSETPDNTSEFYICWSPLDIIYASIANGWGIGNIHFDQRGLYPIVVEITAEVRIGNNGTPTYFGWADIMVLAIRNICEDGWGTQYWHRMEESIIFFGEADYGVDSSVQPVIKNPAVFYGLNAVGWESNIGPGIEEGCDCRLAGGLIIKDGNWRGSNSYALFQLSAGSGTAWTLHNRKLRGIPSTYNSVGNFVNWYGGTWGGALQLGGEITNVVVLDIRGDGEGVANWAGFAWVGPDYATMGDFFQEVINMNVNLVDNFKDASGRDCDYWYVQPTSTNKAQWFAKKTVDITVLDFETKLPVSGVTVIIKNVNGDIISYEDSGSDITGDLGKTDTNLNTDLRENLADSDLIILDNEFISLGTVTSPGSGPGSVIGNTRGARYGASQFIPLPHKYNTPGYDKNIYLVKSLLTDSNGQIPQQKLHGWSMVSDSVPSTSLRSQVTYNGFNYRCKSGQLHQASDANKPTGSASDNTWWQQTGSEGFPWIEGKFYTDGQAGPRSYTDHIPWTIEVYKLGYEKKTVNLNPSFDSEGETFNVYLKRNRIYVDQEEAL